MTTEPAETASARKRVLALRTSLEARDGQAVRLIETHVSWVLLGHENAWKFKKPVRLPFLDFSTLAERRRCCDEELRLNRRLAPALYLDVVDIHETPAGPTFGGSGPVVDAAVRMRRFPDGATWDERLAAGTLNPEDVDAMATRLARFHRDAAVAPQASAFGSPAAHERIAGHLIDAVDAFAARPGVPALPIDWPALRAWLRGQLGALAPVWERRRAVGRVRECHGDLHLANVLGLGDDAVAFDGIEFDPALRWIDVIEDIAFLVMDLFARGRPDLAWRLANAWLEASDEVEGLPILRFHLVCRALVRAQVAMLAPGPVGGVNLYLVAAAALARGADPRLAITHGLPGSGKSHIASAVLEAVGAVRVRSDVERKRLFGLAPLASSRAAAPGGIYGEEATRRTYARLLALAGAALGAGWPVIVDAAFPRRAERSEFAALARELGVPWAIFDCRAEVTLLRERLARRLAAGTDPSEADGAVLERLTGADEPLDAGELAVAIVVDAARPRPTDVDGH